MTVPQQMESEVLAANTRFYRAFSEGDFTAMAALWAQEAPVACFHPGQPLLLGLHAVLRSWREILKPGAPLKLRGEEPRVQLFGDMAIVYCYEAAGDQPPHLAATNVFLREGSSWRMVHHHAGPLSERVTRSSSGFN